MRISIFTFAFALVLAALGIGAKPAVASGTPMYLCNRSGTEIGVVVGYHSSGPGDTGDMLTGPVVSEGWWSLKPGKCRSFANPFAARYMFWNAAPSGTSSMLPSDDFHFCIPNIHADNVPRFTFERQNASEDACVSSTPADSGGPNMWIPAQMVDVMVDANAEYTAAASPSQTMATASAPWWSTLVLKDPINYVSAVRFAGGSELTSSTAVTLGSWSVSKAPDKDISIRNTSYGANVEYSVDGISCSGPGGNYANCSLALQYNPNGLTDYSGNQVSFYCNLSMYHDLSDPVHLISADCPQSIDLLANDRPAWLDVVKDSASSPLGFVRFSDGQELSGTSAVHFGSWSVSAQQQTAISAGTGFIMLYPLACRSEAGATKTCSMSFGYVASQTPSKRFMCRLNLDTVGDDYESLPCPRSVAAKQ
jgi:uncharacterized membrane protein